MERGREKKTEKKKKKKSEKKREKEKEKKCEEKKRRKKQNSDLSRLNLVAEFGWNLFCALFSKIGITFSYEVRFGSASTQMKASDEPHINSCRS